MTYREFYRLFDDFDRTMEGMATPEVMQSVRKKLAQIMKDMPVRQQQAAQINGLGIERRDKINNDPNLSEVECAILELEMVSLLDQGNKLCTSYDNLVAESFILQGDIEAASNDPDNARYYYIRATDNAPKSVSAFARCAIMEMNAGRFWLAEKYYKRALDSQLENPRLLTGMAVCLMELEQTEEAKEILLNITRHIENYDYAPAYFFLSRIESDPYLRDEYFNGAARHSTMAETENAYMEPGTALIVMQYCNYAHPKPEDLGRGPGLG
jgi:tetratricopeptide (TPR) repeat protein